MMRFHTVSSLVLAGCLGIPALASRQDGVLSSLEAALASTESAIAEITGLREKLLLEQPAALERIQEITEGPLSPNSDTVNHIIVIQQEIDALQRSLSEPLAGTGPLQGIRSKVSQGIDTVTKRSAANAARPKAGPDPVDAPPEVHGLRRNERTVALEKEGYSLDDVRRGKLMVRAGRSTEAIAVLQDSTSSEGQYWLGRAWQDLGDLQRALEIYTALEANEEAGIFQRWAAQDRSLLELRQQIKKSDSIEVKIK